MMTMEERNQMALMTGDVFRIQRFCVHDGDGIRTTVFLSGCKLSCAWCHNPEQGRAEAANRMTAEEVIEQVKKDRIYYQTSRGGMTLSGGEPSVQAEFALALLALARDEGIACAMETAGTGDAAFYRAAASYGCTFLCDIKQMDAEMHRRYCGTDNANILENIRLLFSLGADVRIRMPLIPDVNDGAKNIAAVCAFLKSCKIKTIELMPYHNTARGKYASNGEKPLYDRENATDAEICAATELFRKKGITATVSGR